MAALSLNQRARVKKKAGGVACQVFMICLTMFMLFPVFWAFLTSIKPNELIYQYPPVFFSDQFTLDNFSYALRAQNLLRAGFNTFFLSTVTAAVSGVIATLAAYAFSRFRFRGKNLLFGLVVAPMLIPGITNLIPLYSVYTKIGLNDTYLGLILLYIPGTLSFATIVMRSYFDGLPYAIEEAALIDGCSRFSVVGRVVLPVVAPGILAIFIVNFVTIWNDFMITLIFTSSNEMRTLILTIYNMIGTATVKQGPLSATAFMTLLPALLIFLVCRKKFIGTMLDGAIKG